MRCCFTRVRSAALHKGRYDHVCSESFARAASRSAELIGTICCVEPDAADGLEVDEGADTALGDPGDAVDRFLVVVDAVFSSRLQRQNQVSGTRKRSGRQSGWCGLSWLLFSTGARVCGP